MPADSTSKFIYSAPENVALTHQQHPELAASPLHWCKECHHFALVYSLGADKLHCLNCKWVSPN